MVAVDNVQFAGDDRKKYRPHKMPANTHIFTRAGDAGGILRNFLLRHGTVGGSCKGFGFDYDERED
jgi:hypothetical protein